MALYLGNSEELKVYINGVKYKFNLYSNELIINSNVLLSSDDFILRDINGIYLTAKESD